MRIITRRYCTRSISGEMVKGPKTIDFVAIFSIYKNTLLKVCARSISRLVTARVRVYAAVEFCDNCAEEESRIISRYTKPPVLRFGRIYIYNIIQ